MAAKMAATKMSSVTEEVIGLLCGGRGMCIWRSVVGGMAVKCGSWCGAGCGRNVWQESETQP